MKKILLIIALFTSFTINAATYTRFPYKIEFSNDIIVEYSGATASGHGPHGGGGSEYYHDMQITYNGNLFTSQFDDDNFGDNSSHPFGELGWYSNGFNYPGADIPVPEDMQYGSYLSFNFTDSDGTKRSLGAEILGTGEFPTDVGIYFRNNVAFNFSSSDSDIIEPVTINSYTDASIDGNFIPVAETPIPAAIWFFATGLIGLFKLSTRRRNLFEKNTYS